VCVVIVFVVVTDVIVGIVCIEVIWVVSICIGDVSCTRTAVDVVSICVGVVGDVDEGGDGSR
jgi:hypothetical protein